MYEVVCYQWNVKYQEWYDLVWQQVYFSEPLPKQSVVSYEEMTINGDRLEYQYVVTHLDSESVIDVVYSDEEFDPDDFEN